MAEQRDAYRESDSPAHHRAQGSGLLDLPRRDVRSQFMVATFGLLLVTSVVIPALSRVESMPEFTMISFGMAAAGFAELLDPKLYRFVVTLRFVGPAVALFGLALRFV